MKSDIFAISKYIWNAEFSIFQTGIAGITILAVNKPMKYVYKVSVSGYFHALIIVGNVANKSAAANRSIAMSGELAQSHTKRAIIESTPKA